MGRDALCEGLKSSSQTIESCSVQCCHELTILDCLCLKELQMLRMIILDSDGEE